MPIEYTRDIEFTATVPSVERPGDEDVVRALVRAVTYCPLTDEAITGVAHDAARRLAATRGPRTEEALVAAIGRAARAAHTLPWKLQVISPTTHAVAKTINNPEKTNLPTGEALDVLDEDGNPLHVGDAVTLFDRPGRVVVECAAAGIACDGGIDYDELERRAVRATSSLDACRNDHFISLWELAWNLDATDVQLIPGLRVSDETSRANKTQRGETKP